MAEIDIDEFSDYGTVAREWAHHDEGTATLVWQLLDELSDDELLVKLPEWLAEEKVGYTSGGTPTEFVGRIEEETEKTIRFANASAAWPLGQVAHRISALEDGRDTVGLDDDRRDWLERRLKDNRNAFEQRENMLGLREEWLPKSQIAAAVRRAD